MSQRIYCPQCGELNAISRNYCGNCGTDIKQFGADTPQPSPAQQPAPVVVVQQQPRRSSSLSVICIICLIIGCIPILSTIIFYVIVPLFR